jgi:hypothetical protein
MVVVGLLVMGPRTAPRALVLVRAETPVLAGGRSRADLALPPDLDSPTERERLAHATPDDLARGILALSALPPGDSLALSPAQRTRLLAVAAEAASARARRDGVRTEVRRAETAWLDSGTALWSALPSDAQDALRTRGTDSARASELPSPVAPAHPAHPPPSLPAEAPP